MSPSVVANRTRGLSAASSWQANSREQAESSSFFSIVGLFCFQVWLECLNLGEEVEQGGVEAFWLVQRGSMARVLDHHQTRAWAIPSHRWPCAQLRRSPGRR